MTKQTIQPELVRTMSDADLLAAYERTDGEPDHPEVEALLAGIPRRDLDL